MLCASISRRVSSFKDIGVVGGSKGHMSKGEFLPSTSYGISRHH